MAKRYMPVVESNIDEVDPIQLQLQLLKAANREIFGCDVEIIVKGIYTREEMDKREAR